MSARDDYPPRTPMAALREIDELRAEVAWLRAQVESVRGVTVTSGELVGVDIDDEPRDLGGLVATVTDVVSGVLINRYSYVLSQGPAVAYAVQNLDPTVVPCVEVMCGDTVLIRWILGAGSGADTGFIVDDLDDLHVEVRVAEPLGPGMLTIEV